jgi:hypothetical protein
VLLRLTYLAVTNTFVLLRLLPMSDREKEVEILALRHELLVRPAISPVPMLRVPRRGQPKKIPHFPHSLATGGEGPIVTPTRHP